MKPPEVNRHIQIKSQHVYVVRDTETDAVVMTTTQRHRAKVAAGQSSDAQTRGYNVGVPAYVWVHDDGSLVIEFYLEEVADDLGQEDDLPYTDTEVEVDMQTATAALEAFGNLCVVDIPAPTVQED